MQNWYSQKSPFRSNGVAVGSMVGMGRGVVVAGIIASVVATASSTGNVGVNVLLVGSEQPAKTNKSTIPVKNRLMHGLYSFSEQFNSCNVIGVKGAKMKKILISIALVAVLLGACAPQGLPTELPPEVIEQATEISKQLTPAQEAAIAAVVQNLGVAAEQVKVVSTEAVEWPDSCLGIAMEGVSCAQVVTPGFRVTLDVAGKQVEYRTNQDASVIRPATTALTWNRVGGIAGFCDSLTIYLSGEVQATNCNTSEVVEKRLSELASPEQIAMMDELISKYGLMEIDASDPQGVADAMSVKLQLMGQGTEELTSPQVQQILMQFIQDLQNRMMNQ